jgi:acyl-coenzyme A synthetase/AMP-(fatty) acid ligase
MTCARRPAEVGAAQSRSVTPGSRGLPNVEGWRGFRRHADIEVLTRVLGLADGQIASVLATVPAQHMYGMELSVLLPLFGPFSVHSGRPFFPADIACELASLPAPRVLVTTPVHLQALLRESQALPPLAAIVCATAPLSRELAQAVESKYQAPLIEMFGSTETCVIAHRRTASESDWQTHPSVVLSPHAEGTLVTADHLCAPVQLQDIVELHGSGRFRLCGRNADLLEIGGKRASLADLTRRLQSIDGVDDAVVFQLDGSGPKCAVSCPAVALGVHNGFAGAVARSR